MKCLCCGKEVKSTNGWHDSCIKAFFNTSILPVLDSENLRTTLEEMGNEYLSENKSVTGVQKKLSLHLSKEIGNYRLTLIGYPQGYILKPNSNEYPFIAEAEHLVMLMANECNIKTAPHALIKINDEYAYITKRIDRVNNEKRHMEDFCQLANRPTEYKYNGSYEKCAKIIDQYSINPMIDKVELYYRLCFCYIVGNSDMHLKNFSLIEKDGKHALSAAYDLLPVKLIINDEEDLALTLNGKKKNITRKDFLNFSESIGMDRKVAIKLLDSILCKKEKFISMINESLIPEDSKVKFIEYISDKIDFLK